MTYLWYVAATVIALLGTGALSTLSRYSTLITLFVLIVAIGEIFLLPLIRRRRVLAAGIQELFDCEVLQLAWNRSLERPPDPHDIDWAVGRFKRRKKQEVEWEGLRNWYGYSPLIKTVPLGRARLECQQENLYWDAGLRRFWRGLLLALLISVIVALAIIGERANLSAQQYLSGPVLLIIPVAFGVLKTIVDHRKAMERLSYLLGVLEDLKEDAEKTAPAEISDILMRTRELQTEIYHHRCDDSPVPDEIYRWLRNRFQPQAKAR